MPRRSCEGELRFKTIFNRRNQIVKQRRMPLLNPKQLLRLHINIRPRRDIDVMIYEEPSSSIISAQNSAFLLWALKTQVTFLLALKDQHYMFLRFLFVHSLCAFSSFETYSFAQHQSFLFRLLFKSLFSFCLKKMVRSIIVKGGVSRERVVVKDSNDFSRLPGH